MRAMSPIAVVYMLATEGIGGANPIADPVIGTATMAIALLRLLLVRYTTVSLRIAWLFLLDFMLHKIPPDEEEHSYGTRLPRQHIRIDSWIEQECYDFTSFTQDQLRRIYVLFGLTQLAAQTDGYIRVFTGHEHYRFHPEEIYLFFMTKCRTGYGNSEMCKLIFGGDQLRWSFGFPWILEYLDTRYARTISHEKLRDC